MISILKLAFQLTKIVIVGFYLENGKLIIKVRPHAKRQARCPKCGKVCRVYDIAKNPKRWRTLDLGGLKVYLEYRPKRIKCKDHKVLVEEIPWARRNTCFSKIFEDWVACLTLNCSISAVASYARIEWHSVGNICKRVYDDLLASNSINLYGGLKRIGIDETSYKKGHKYITVIVNHDTSSLVWAHEGKGEDVLKLFFAQLTPYQRNCIEVVTADGARWIKKVVKRKCKNAVICMDPFHVVSWMNSALDEVRRNEWSEAKKLYTQLKPPKRKKPGRPKKEEENNEFKEAKKAMDEIKNSRWAVLKNPDNLSDAQNKKLTNIKKKADSHLFKTWEFKEDLRAIFKFKYAKVAEKHLDEWLHRAAYSRIPQVVEVEQKIRKRKEDVLSAIRLGLGNGRIEAVNNKIKITVKIGYGFRNVDNLIALLMLRCSPIKPTLPFIPVIENKSEKRRA